MDITWNRVNAFLLLLVLAGVLLVLETRGEAGPLDPESPLGSTDGVRLPGTPITGTTEITQSGHYYLTRNLVVGATSGITINASNVTVDLNGFTISGVDTPSIRGIHIVSGDRITIQNGIVRDLHTGILTSNSKHLHIKNVHGYSNLTAFSIAEDGVIEDCTASNGGIGINISQSRATVRRCHISANSSSGIVLQQLATGVLIEESSIKNNNASVFATQGGIRLEANPRNTMRNNDMDANGVADIQIFDSDHNVIIDNVLNCPTSIINGGTTPGANNVFPVNTTDPHTNRTHRPAC